MCSSDLVMQQAPVKSAVLAWILAWGIGGAIYGTYRQRISKGIGVMLLGSASILAVSYLSFNSGWSIPAVSPLLVWNMSTGSAMFISLWNALERSRDDLRKYAVTLEEKNQELKRLDELKDEFLANTSHELRTPIHGIVGLSEALIQGTAGPMHKPQEENLRLIADSGRRLANLVDRSEEHTSELQSLTNLVCRLLLEKKKKNENKNKSQVEIGRAHRLENSDNSITAQA